MIETDPEPFELVVLDELDALLVPAVEEGDVEEALLVSAVAVGEDDEADDPQSAGAHSQVFSSTLLTLSTKHW